MLDMLTIEPDPRSSMRVTASRAQKNAPFRWISSMRVQPASLMCGVIEPVREDSSDPSPGVWSTPALFTSTSRRPQVLVDLARDLGHARAVGDVAREREVPAARQPLDGLLRGLGPQVVHRHARALGREPLADRAAEARAAAGHPRHAPVELHRPSYLSVPAKNSRTTRMNSSKRSWCTQCPAPSTLTTARVRERRRAAVALGIAGPALGAAHEQQRAGDRGGASRAALRR